MRRVVGGMEAINAVGARESDKLAALEKELRATFAAINLGVPANEAAWRALAATIDLSTESGRRLFDVMSNGAQTFAQVQAAFEQSMAGIYQSAQSIFGGQFSSTFARARLETTFARWQEMRGENATWEEMLAAFQWFGQDPSRLQPAIDATRNQYGAAGVALLEQLWQDYAAYAQSLGSSAQSITTSLGDFGVAIDNIVGQLLNAQSGLADYLRGLGQSELSPFNPQERYADARRVYLEQLGLAQGGNVDALSGLSGYHQAFLRASRAIHASGGQYNADYFSSYNQLASLTGGQVGPLTGAQFSAGNNAVVAELKTLREQTHEADQRQIDAIIALANVVAAASETSDAQMQAKMDALIIETRRASMTSVA
jgi:hypothetical protein